MKYTAGNRNKWKTLFSSQDEAWRTPPGVFAHFDKKYHFNFDAAASPYNALTKQYFTKNENALERDWCKKGKGKKKRVIWLNPPYSRSLYKWIEKAYTESKKGCTVAVLVFARTDTRWWHDFVLPHAYKIYFIKGRLRFGNATAGAPFLDSKTGKIKGPATAPSCVIIFKRNRQKHPIVVSEIIHDK